MKSSLILIVLLLGFAFAGQANAATWRGITPLRSDCKTIEAAFGIQDCVNAKEYELEEEWVSFRISDGFPCNEKWPQGQWRVKKGIVVSIYVRPKARRDISFYETNLEGFTRTEGAGGMSYWSDSKGIVYNVEADGTVRNYSYYPTTADRAQACPGAFDDDGPNWHPCGGDKIGSHTREFNVSGRIARSVAEDLVVRLQTCENCAVYLISYGGRTSYPNEAVDRARHLRNELAKYGVLRDRIRIVDAGYRERWEVEISYSWIDCERRLMYPTVHPSQVRMRRARGKKP